VKTNGWNYITRAAENYRYPAGRLPMVRARQRHCPAALMPIINYFFVKEKFKGALNNSGDEIDLTATPTI